VINFFICGIILLVAMIMDIKKYEVSNVLWGIGAMIGILFLISGVIECTAYTLLAIGLCSIFGVLSIFSGIGASDSKALLTMGLIVPLYPTIQYVVPFPILVFISGLFISILMIFCYGLFMKLLITSIDGFLNPFTHNIINIPLKEIIKDVKIPFIFPLFIGYIMVLVILL